MNDEIRRLTMAAWFGVIALMATLASPLVADVSSQTTSTPQDDANPVILKAEPATKVDLLNMKDELKYSMRSAERYFINIVLTVSGIMVAIAIAIFALLAQIFRRLGALEQLHKDASPAPPPTETPAPPPTENRTQTHNESAAFVDVNGLPPPQD